MDALWCSIKLCANINCKINLKIVCSIAKINKVWHIKFAENRGFGAEI